MARVDGRSAANTVAGSRGTSIRGRVSVGALPLLSSLRQCCPVGSRLAVVEVAVSCQLLFSGHSSARERKAKAEARLMQAWTLCRGMVPGISDVLVIFDHSA